MLKRNGRKVYRIERRKARNELDDLFKDMEPVIQKTSRLVIEEADASPDIVPQSLTDKLSSSDSTSKSNNSSKTSEKSAVLEPVSLNSTRFEMHVEDGIENGDGVGDHEGGWGNSNDWE